LAHVLEDRAMKDDILIGDTPKAVRRRKRLKTLTSSGRLWKHSKISDIHGLVSDQEIEKFFVFTLVRNPWDRMVSYYHWLRVQRFEHEAVNIAKDTDFSTFLNHPYTLRSVGSEQYAQYVCDRRGTEKCNLFVRLEYLKTDLEPLEHHLGFSLGRIEKTNQSDRDHDYHKYFDSDDANLVANMFSDDIQRFRYSF